MSRTAPDDTTASRSGIVLAWIAVALLVGFLVLGAIWYGGSADVSERVWRDIAQRPGGPMTFRFVLQPTMAVIAATRDGVKDARLGRSPYFWTLLSNPAVRRERLREGLISVAQIILFGLGMDVIYQYRVLGTFYPGEAVLIALLLAVVPYFILRGIVTRVARRRLARKQRDTGSV